jgi:hypothetical protein
LSKEIKMIKDKALKMALAAAYAVYDDARLARVKALGDYDKARLALSDAETAEQVARTALGVAMSGDTNYSEVNYDAH